MRPIQAVTDGARAMARGELDQLVPAASRDELGDLANAFNEMARTLREYRQAGTARLLRAERPPRPRSTRSPIRWWSSIPSARSNRPTAALGGFWAWRPAAEPAVAWAAGPAACKSLISDVLAGHGDYLPLSLEQAIPLYDGGQERYYLPRVVAIRTERDELIGAAVALADVTKFHLLDRLKSDMVATVSHELKTPLTSVQMAIHLLLEEVVGPLTPKQVELLLAARQDADRILTMINDLLDLTRIEQGRVRLDLEPLPAADLVDEAVARFQPQAQRARRHAHGQGRGPGPTVMVDRDRIEHVFDNLIVNAIQHTNRGGTVKVRRRRDGGQHAVRASRIPAREYRPNTSLGFSRSFIACRRHGIPGARAWAWRSCARSSRRTAAKSASRASREKGPNSHSHCRPSAWQTSRPLWKGEDKWAQRSAS